MPFKNDTDPDLISKSAAVAQAFTPEAYAHLVSLLPTPEVFQTNHNNYTASYTASLAGDPEKAKECEMYRNSVYEGLSILFGVAKAVTVKDPKAPDIVGVGSIPVRSTTGSTTLPQPTDFKVFFTRDGRIVASVTKVQGAKGYQVWTCDGDPNIETNWRLSTSSSSSRGIVVPGLDHGKNNWLKIRAIRGKGIASPWSNLVNLTPT